MLEIYDLKTESQINPLGIDHVKPEFSWKLKSSNDNVTQVSYQIILRSPNGVVWDTELVESDQSIHITYHGEALLPATKYTFHVEIVDNYSEKATRDGWFETGLLTYENFKVDWITHGFEDDLEPCAIFYKEFNLFKNVKSARVYASALGVYELTLNSEKVGDVHMSPGWTCYNERLHYQTYDISQILAKTNRIELTVGNGWYKGILGFNNQGNHYGNRTAVIAQVEIVFEDGTKEIWGTDETWKSTTGAHRYNQIYHGETIDYSLEEQKIVDVQLYYHPKNILIGQENEPMKITERLQAKELIITPNGEVVLDFGQNMAGIVEAKINAPKGTEVIVKHAETLDENGNFYTVNLRTAKATNTFICSGGDDVFRPAFTYQGFRYIQIIGLGEKLNLDDFTACAVHSDMTDTGEFTCSRQDVNKLWKNIKWTLRSNFLDIPLDCPQRDERLGYTGDAQMFAPTAAFIKDVSLFFSKWLKDLKVEQSDELGGVPMTVPNILGPSGGISIWHEAAVIIPWILWRSYGNKRVLKEQYESMKSCVEFTRNRVGENGLLQTGLQLGDWIALDMERGPMRPPTGEIINLGYHQKTGSTDVYYISNAYYAYSADILAQTAEILEKNEDAKEYRKLHQEIVKNFRYEYVSKSGRLISETQTGCSMALQLNLVEDKDRERVIESLLANLQRRENYLTTGFVGTQFLCHALSDNGAHDVAGKIFLKEDAPSWLYSVNLGGTTVWELWDGVNLDGSFNKYEMNSLNHFTLASIGDWMHTRLGGLSILKPGYKKSKIAPRLIRGITSMKTTIQTVYGELSCSISCKDKKYSVEIRVPENTTALVCLPERDEVTVGSGVYQYEYATEQSFELGRFTGESKLSKLLEDPLGLQIFKESAAELIEDEMFMKFAKDRTILGIIAMVPEEVSKDIYKILNILNSECS